MEGKCCMKRNTVKILLDIVMVILLFAMYSKNAVNINFHEFGGLAVCGLFLIHKGLSWRWIISITKRFFNPSLPAKTRIGYIVDFLLLISMTFILISGIMISKDIFIGISSNWSGWRIGHYFSSAVAVILVGIHIGLHWSFIKSMLNKILRLPRIVSRTLAIFFIVAILAYGGYGIVTTNFGQWLGAPFTVHSATGSKMTHSGAGSSDGKRQNRGEHTEEFAKSGDGKGNLNKLPGETFNIGRFLEVVVSFASISFFFAALTVLLEELIKRFKYPVLLRKE